jgi:hypothetical protein
MPWSSGYLAEEERDNGAALKKAIEGVISDMAFALQSEKQLSALELASDRQIRRNASRLEQFGWSRVTPPAEPVRSLIDTRYRAAAASSVQRSSLGSR